MMRESTALVVAPREDAARVATTSPRERPWPQAPVEDMAREELVLIHAHLDGADADTQVAVGGQRNPFTGRAYTVPKAMLDYEGQFAWVSGGDDDNDSGRTTYACPEGFTTQLAKLSDAALVQLATKWCASMKKMADAQGATARWTPSSAEVTLGSLRTMARIAVDRGHTLFLAIRM